LRSKVFEPMLRSIPPLSVLLAALAVLGMACAGDGGQSDAAPTTSAGATPGATATKGPSSKQSGPKLELEGITAWLNTEPVTIEDLVAANRVVLVDFWTYTCVNCLRTLPFLREWHAKYKDLGLTIVGVHTPEFEFEKVKANVEKALSEHEIGWAVAQDNDYRTWNAFGNRYWPAKYLIGKDGEVRYTHFGEGAYVETEKEIRAALADFGYNVDSVPIGAVNEQIRDGKATTVTREIYGGYERNFDFFGQYAGQDEYYGSPDKVIEYKDDGSYAHNKFYLSGPWRNEKEAIVHARDTAEPEDYIALTIAATSANVVIDPQGPEPFDVIVELDGKPLAREQAGVDVNFDGKGRSVVRVSGARLYSLVQLPEFGIHTLKLSSTSKNFGVFAFTFGVYESGI